MPRILLIDDDSVLLKLYSTRLASDGHQVETAVNGEEGLAKVQSFKPEMIIIDLLMPKVNGFSFIEKLNQNPVTKAIPKIVFSSVASQEQIQRLQTMGIGDYVNKTDTTPTQLVNLINQRLGYTPTPPPAATPPNQPQTN